MQGRRRSGGVAILLLVAAVCARAAQDGPLKAAVEDFHKALEKEDFLYAAGFVEAQDRKFQIELWERGRAAGAFERFGEVRRIEWVEEDRLAVVEVSTRKGEADAASREHWILEGGRWTRSRLDLFILCAATRVQAQGTQETCAAFHRARGEFIRSAREAEAAAEQDRRSQKAGADRLTVSRDELSSETLLLLRLQKARRQVEDAMVPLLRSLEMTPADLERLRERCRRADRNGPKEASLEAGIEATEKALAQGDEIQALAELSRLVAAPEAFPRVTAAHLDLLERVLVARQAPLQGKPGITAREAVTQVLAAIQTACEEKTREENVSSDAISGFVDLQSDLVELQIEETELLKQEWTERLLNLQDEISVLEELQRGVSSEKKAGEPISRKSRQIAEDRKKAIAQSLREKRQKTKGSYPSNPG